MSGTSNVGQASVYEAGDQRNNAQSEVEQEKKDARFHEGQTHSHKALDSKDERTIANKLAREEKREGEDEPESEETKALKQDPTLPVRIARFHMSIYTDFAFVGQATRQRAKQGC
ncbi:hypothetical protein PVAG01_08254 [Phlyctema vagabunda]|uniref:Uncharacterized protein n=1 Tax=Phlyctema vagabunda TaxID=108571 RepID=A0ABR4P8W2_9HELO